MNELEVQKPKSDRDPDFPRENINICQKFLDESGFISKWSKAIPLENIDRGMHISFCTGMHYFYSYGNNPPGDDGKIFATGKEKSEEGAFLKRSALFDGDQADKALHKIISNDRIKMKKI